MISYPDSDDRRLGLWRQPPALGNPAGQELRRTSPPRERLTVRCLRGRPGLPRCWTVSTDEDLAVLSGVAATRRRLSPGTPTGKDISDQYAPHRGHLYRGSGSQFLTADMNLYRSVATARRPESSS